MFFPLFSGVKKNEKTCKTCWCVVCHAFRYGFSFHFAVSHYSKLKVKSLIFLRLSIVSLRLHAADLRCFNKYLNASMNNGLK